MLLPEWSLLVAMAMDLRLSVERVRSSLSPVSCHSPLRWRLPMHESCPDTLLLRLSVHRLQLAVLLRLPSTHRSPPSPWSAQRSTLERRPSAERASSRLHCAQLGSRAVLPSAPPTRHSLRQLQPALRQRASSAVRVREPERQAFRDAQPTPPYEQRAPLAELPTLPSALRASALRPRVPPALPRSVVDTPRSSPYSHPATHLQLQRLISYTNCFVFCV